MARAAAVSALDSMSDSASAEVVFRIDSDDDISLRHIWSLSNDHRFRVVIGPRYRGYEDMHRFYHEAACQASGKWLWLLNDDCSVSGRGIDEILLGLPVHLCIVKPEDGFDGKGGQSLFPIFPRLIHTATGRLGTTFGVDSYLYWLADCMTLPYYYAESIRVTHDRQPVDDSQVRLLQESNVYWRGTEVAKMSLAEDASALRRVLGVN